LRKILQAIRASLLAKAVASDVAFFPSLKTLRQNA
jgi:hypothetical protein